MGLNGRKLQGGQRVRKCMMKHLHKDKMGHVYDIYVSNLSEVDPRCPECGTPLQKI